MDKQDSSCASSQTTCYTVSQFILILPILITSSIGSFPFDQIVDQVVYTKYGGDISGRNAHSTCVSNDSARKHHEDVVQSETTEFKLYLSVGACLCGMVAMPFWMGWSDQSGRQIGLIVAIFGNFCKALMLLYIVAIPEIPLWVLIVSESCYGLLGKGTATVFAAAASHIGDIMPFGRRTITMLIIEFVFLSSAAAGNFITGVWISRSGFIPVTLFSMSLHAFALIYTMIAFAKCTKPFSRRIESFSLLSYLSSSLRTFVRHRPERSHVRPLLLILAGVIFSNYAGFLGCYNLINVYALGSPFCFSSFLVGVNSAVLVLSSGIFPLMIGLMFYSHGPSAWLVVIGLSGGIAGALLIGFAQSAWMILLGSVIFALRTLVSGTCRSLICDLVDSHEIGNFILYKHQSLYFYCFLVFLQAQAWLVTVLSRFVLIFFQPSFSTRCTQKQWPPAKGAFSTLVLLVSPQRSSSYGKQFQQFQLKHPR